MSGGAAASPECAAPADWPDFVTSKERIDQIFMFHSPGVEDLPDADFKLLGRIEAELGYSKRTFGDGTHHFDALHASIRETFQYQPQRGLGVAKEWLAADAGSGYAHLVRAMAYYGQAWEARGRGYADTVQPEAWQLFHANLEKADAALNAAPQRLKDTGPWHALKLQIAVEHPKLRKNASDLLDRGSTAWPAYLTLYQFAMNYARPQWGGSYEDMERVAQVAARKNPGHGAAMYARVYEKAFRGARSCCKLEDSRVDRALLKKGFRESETVYPEPPWLFKGYAQMACDLRDRPEAKRLYQVHDRRTGEHADPNDPCRVFADGEDPQGNSQ